MFEFEITLEKEYNPATHEWENPVIKGTANGCIDDYLVRTIVSKGTNGYDYQYIKIGDVVVKEYKLQSIRVKAVGV